ncbi:MAG: hypothetical protein RLZZ403_873 [Pseudomonadota bacterium]|jgi:hypothetical protein
MEFWTVMIIVYGTTTLGSDASLIPYPNRAACGDAIEFVFGTLEETFPDLSIHCVETDEFSRMVRPKPRPEGLGQ